MFDKCPNCGADINYAFKYSYYLRCKRSFSCWHESCDKATAEKYPMYIDPDEESMAFSMREKLQDDECDYFYDDECDYF